MSVDYISFIATDQNGTYTRWQFTFDVPLVLSANDKLNILFRSQPNGLVVATHEIDRAECVVDRTGVGNPAHLLLRELPEMGCWSFLPDAFKYRVIALINKEQA